MVHPLLRGPTDTHNRRLDVEKRCDRGGRFESRLSARVIGQDAAVRLLGRMYQTFVAGTHDRRRPLGVALFLGPTGCGKTRVAEAAGEAIFGDARAVLRIDCAAYQQPHELIRLFGAPPWPGQTGASPVPLLAQENLDRFQSAENPLSIVLFDEIEKASELLWQSVLSALGKGRITLADGRSVDFSRSIIILTSNVGAREITEAINGGAGFKAAWSDDTGVRQRGVAAAALRAARERFSPEFLNRVDETVVFEPLEPDDLRQIVRLEIAAVEQRIRARYDAPFTLHYSEQALALLMAQGTDRRSYARNLKRTIDRLLVAPVSALLATGQIGAGDAVTVDAHADLAELVFDCCTSRAPGASLQPGARPIAEGVSVALPAPATIRHEPNRGDAAMQQLAATMMRAGLA